MGNEIHFPITKFGLGMIGTDQNFVTFSQGNLPLLTHRPAFRQVKRQITFFVQKIKRMDALGVCPDDLKPVSTPPALFAALDEGKDLAPLAGYRLSTTMPKTPG